MKNKSVKPKPQNRNEKTRSRGVSQWNIAWRRFKKNKAALAGALIIGFVIFPISVVIEMQKRKDILWSIAWLFLLPIVISPIYYLKKIRKTLR